MDISTLVQICPGCTKPLNTGERTQHYHSDEQGSPWHLACYRAAGKVEYVPPKLTRWQRFLNCI